jgi:hypothetical protein
MQHHHEESKIKKDRLKIPNINCNRIPMKTKMTTLSTIVLIIVLLTFNNTKATAQQDHRKIRIANIQIDSSYIDQYRSLLPSTQKLQFE